MGSNPIKRIDIKGKDWYCSQDGNKEWIDSKADTYIKSDNSLWMRFEHFTYLDAVEITPAKEEPKGALDIADAANTSAGLGISILETTVDVLKVIEPTLNTTIDLLGATGNKLGIIGLSLDAVDFASDPSIGKWFMLSIDAGVLLAGGPAALGIVDGLLDITGVKEAIVNGIDNSEVGKGLNEAMKNSFDGLEEMLSPRKKEDTEVE